MLIHRLQRFYETYAILLCLSQNINFALDYFPHLNFNMPSCSIFWKRCLGCEVAACGRPRAMLTDKIWPTNMFRWDLRKNWKKLNFC